MPHHKIVAPSYDEAAGPQKGDDCVLQRWVRLVGWERLQAASIASTAACTSRGAGILATFCDQ